MVLPGIFKPRKNSEAESKKTSKDRKASSRSPSSRSPSKSPSKSLRESDLRHQQRKGASRYNSKSSLNVDTHPLNLPPDERDKRRSAMSALSDPPTPMDVDRDEETSSDASTPPPAAPNNRSDLNGASDDSDVERTTSPIPPPHRFIPTASPPPKPALDPEACKMLGNKYFNNKDYVKAIAEYTK
ncbi:MAG: hypothetical protein L6R41_004661, partial [Letrouitia leprolyta]